MSSAKITAFPISQLSPGTIVGYDPGVLQSSSMLPMGSHMNYAADVQAIQRATRVTVDSLVAKKVAEHLKTADVATLRIIAGGLVTSDAAPLLGLANRIERLLKGEA